VTSCEKILANHVKGYGGDLVEAEAGPIVEGVCSVMSNVSQAAMVQPQRPIFYVGADGIHTPLIQEGSREAKVGVMFWESDYLRLCPTQSVVQRRDYIATLKSVEGFREQLMSKPFNSAPSGRLSGYGVAWILADGCSLVPRLYRDSQFLPCLGIPLGCRRHELC
jgi:hypothetical protein